MNKEIDSLINDTIENNKYIKNKNGLFIKNYYIDILKKYDIDILNSNKLSDIIFLIDNILNTNEELTDEEYFELDTIVNELQEKQYYENTNK